MTRAHSLLGLTVLLALAGCSAPADAPTNPGVCWVQAPAAGKAKPALALLSRGDANLETCAMHLELTRISRHTSTLIGAFQGQYVFVDRDAIAASDSLSGQRFSLFSPGQRADLDAQIVDLLKTQKTAPTKQDGGAVAAPKVAP